MDIEKKLSHVEFLNRENNSTHLSYERENEFFQSIKDGNIEKAKKLFKPFNSKEMGVLSDNSLQNLKYHLIITVAFITRCCIEGGMGMESAYNLSDIYVRSVDKCKTEAEINLLHREVVEDYVQRMYILRKQNPYPKAVTLCIDYIYDNLHTKITLEKLAEFVHLSPGYLSRLFHKEVGVSVSEYIQKKRIETAENMLKYSDYEYVDIAEYLCFSSESHFIQTFKKYNNCTPRAYRNNYFRHRK